MREHSISFLKGLCLAFALLLAYQFAHLAARRDPFKNLRLPALPSAAAEPAASGGTNSVSPGIGKAPGPGVVFPAAIQARIERIKETEMFGPVPRPPVITMALLGIAGDDALIRFPDGQTSLVKEGSELNGVKLLQIGTNRVLVERAGQKEELTIFAGFGGESLLPKGKEKSP